jgi:hypothetical protein
MRISKGTWGTTLHDRGAQAREDVSRIPRGRRQREPDRRAAQAGLRSGSRGGRVAVEGRASENARSSLTIATDLPVFGPTTVDVEQEPATRSLVVVGSGDDLYHAFMRAGWDETEVVTTQSAWKTAVAFISGGRYRYSPVSSLYVFGRRQDVALQKARGRIHERNHLRLWLAPLRFRGKLVWVGQISRDIGVRFTR